jgi:hypothetical protein
MTATYPVISWRQLHGKKFLYQLHPDMLSDSGYLRDLEIRPVPYKQFLEKSWFTVQFDRDYAIGKLAYEIKDCGDVPFLDLVEVLAEAYTIVNPDAPVIGLMSEIKSAVSEVISFDPLSLSGSW